ncbi:MAG: gliding motility-associated C-terminal domain-containing protein [Saprospiraceae bacterium]
MPSCSPFLPAFLLLALATAVRAQPAPCLTTGPNLIVNGDFEQGYFAFTSDFGRGLNNATLGNCDTQGWILVAQVDPHANGPGCKIYPFYLSGQYGSPNTPTSADPNDVSNTSVISNLDCEFPLPDHTTGNGFFLTIDPDAIPGRAYWKQTIEVCPQTNYVFSVWVRNVSPGCGLPAPFFHFEVGGVPINPPTSYPDCEWVNTSAHWQSGNLSGPVQIQLVNDQPGCIANDVAIDDVFFGICNGAILNSTPVFEFCGDSLGADAVLSGSSYGFVNPQFQWQRLDAQAGAWTNIAGATDSMLVFLNATAADAGTYRFISWPGGIPLADACSFAISPYSRIIAHPEYDQALEINIICEGDSYAGYSATGQYLDTFQSIYGCDSIRLLTLHVRPHYYNTTRLTLCPGAQYNFNGTILSESGIYLDSLSTVFGCDSLFRLELEIPPAAFLGPDTTLCTADSYRLTGPSPQTRWSDGSTGPELLVTESGVYTASFTDTSGCTVRDTIGVQFRPKVYVPNAFSPNDDGTNDAFLPSLSAIDLAGYRMQIFDRWGDALFSSEDPGHGWDGTSRSRECVPAVYIYLIEAITATCGKTVWKGDVLLVR